MIFHAAITYVYTSICSLAINFEGKGGGSLVLRNPNVIANKTIALL